jgi:hypothetical protein
MTNSHIAWAGANADSTAVAIGVHAEMVAREEFPNGPIAQTLTSFLNHVQKRQEDCGVEITFSRASEIAEIFYVNTTTGAVH